MRASDLVEAKLVVWDAGLLAGVRCQIAGPEPGSSGQRIRELGVDRALGRARAGA
jgi:hypothetical protein